MPWIHHPTVCESRSIARDGGARALGCYSSPRSGGEGLVGKRIHVKIPQLLIYHDPAKSYVGSLQRGQSFKVRRLSPSGKYAYGFAYGKLNQNAWVRTSKLTAR